MHIRQLDVTVREIAKNYINNNDENGVIGYDGNLNIRPAYQREFVYKDKRTAYERQHGICPIDGLHYEISEMEAHHILAWDNGGKTILENCVMVAKKNHKNIHNGLVTPTELREKRDAIVA